MLKRAGGSRRFDAAIVGGGAAGLRAAAELSKSGKRVLLLEARDRLGGRIHSEPHALGGQELPVELGAEFVHEVSDEFDLLFAASGTALLEGEGSHWHLQGRRLQEVPDFWDEVDRGLRNLKAPRGADRPIAALLPRNPHTLRDRLVRRFVEGFNAAPATELSAQALLRSHHEAMEEGGYKSFRPLGGFRRLLDGLQQQLDPELVAIRSNACVTSVEWRRGRVAVTFTGADREVEQAVARTLIATVPAAVLALPPGARAAIAFEPPLPAKRQAAAAIGVGAVVKAIVRLGGSMTQTRLLEARPEFEGAQFVHVEGAAFPTWWTKFPYRSAFLTGWAGGPDALRLSGLRHPEIERAALASLGRVLGTSRRVTAASVQQLWIHDWQRDPFSRGAYSYLRTGETRAPAALARPVEDTLFFAGEATTTEGVGGTVGSALSSGARAAREVLASLAVSGGRTRRTAARSRRRTAG